MLADPWLFRDSNWGPDVPIAAQEAVELFTISRETRVAGVIALDQRAITLLLEPLGPIPVAGVDEPITSQNVLQVARRAWAPGEALESPWWQSRKDMMGRVLDTALFQLEGRLNREQMVGLSSAALQALRGKHLLVYVRDEEAAALRRELGRTVFATFLVLRPSEHLETTFAYTLPQAILERTEAGWRYRVTVQKQPGTDAQPLSVALRLPAEAEVVAADPRPAQRDENVLTYDSSTRSLGSAQYQELPRVIRLVVSVLVINVSAESFVLDLGQVDGGAVLLEERKQFLL